MSEILPYVVGAMIGVAILALIGTFYTSEANECSKRGGVVVTDVWCVSHCVAAPGASK